MFFHHFVSNRFSKVFPKVFPKVFWFPELRPLFAPQFAPAELPVHLLNALGFAHFHPSEVGEVGQCGGYPNIWRVYFMENAMNMDDLGVPLFQET
jgi:hypothetical protein